MFRHSVLLTTLLGLAASVLAAPDDPYTFTPADIRFLSAFTLEQQTLPPAPGNRLADNDTAAHLGQRLFYDTAFSANGQVACASCHQPDRYFTDGLPQSQALGTTRRNAPSIPGALYGPWQFWDGRVDSLWSQALNPMEAPHEQGLDRLRAAQRFLARYPKAYAELFGDSDAARRVKALPDTPASPKQPGKPAETWAALSPADQDAVNRVFSQLGKVIMAYERRLTLEPAPFDRFVNALEAGAPRDRLAALMTESQVDGMRLFMGRANCASCHNGPMFTNFEFHNIGAPEPDKTDVDLGRFQGVSDLQTDTFTCLSDYSDAGPNDCAEMRFLKVQGPELVGAFKTPSLRNVAETAPYMQAGQLATLAEVVAHYNAPKPPYYNRDQHPSRPHFDILPLGLTETEQAQLIAFLQTLTSPIPKDDPWWGPAME